MENVIEYSFEKSSHCPHRVSSERQLRNSYKCGEGAVEGRSKGVRSVLKDQEGVCVCVCVCVCVEASAIIAEIRRRAEGGLRVWVSV